MSVIKGYTYIDTIKHIGKRCSIVKKNQEVMYEFDTEVRISEPPTYFGSGGMRNYGYGPIKQYGDLTLISVNQELNFSLENNTRISKVILTTEQVIITLYALDLSKIETEMCHNRGNMFYKYTLQPQYVEHKIN